VVKNLEVNNSSVYKINKLFIHKIAGLLKNEFNLSISSLLINFVSSSQIIQINNNFLKHNYSTDIITFNYSNKRQFIDSEIYISLEDAENNAKKFDVTFTEEILRLVIHGFLHLIGYDDKKFDKKKEMKGIENNLFEKYSEILLIRTGTKN
jgi:probable rRNA maturation factor